MRLLPVRPLSGGRPAAVVLAAALVVAAALALFAGGCAQRPKTSIASLAWLSGCWEGKTDEGRMDEQWSKPAGGSLLGTSRVVKGERTVFVEFLQLREGADGLILTVHPQGQPPVSYRLKRSGKTNATFENPTHDFPQRIIYHRDGNTLHVRAEGEPSDSRRQIRIKLRRTACD